MKIPGLLSWIGAAIIAFTLFTQWASVEQVLHLKEERAQALNVRYGLLSLDEWKEKSFVAVSSRVEEFRLDGKDKASLRLQIENLLRTLLNDVRSIVEEQSKIGSWWERSIRSLLQDLLIDFNGLEVKIPEITDKIIAEIGNQNNQQQIKSLIIRKLRELLDMDAPRIDQELRSYYQATYGCANLEACGELLETEIAPIDSLINATRPLFLAITGVCILIFLLAGKSAANKFNITGLTAMCGTLLFGGVFLPMISVDARILDFKFEMLGMSIDFKEQVLFYQSKSVMDIVQLLFTKGEIDTILVAGLILLFSVLFPISKLILSLLVHPSSTDSLSLYLTTKASKWSMADVFVVAIIMGFVGLRGIISSQMEEIGTENPFIDLIATDYTSLNVGFTLFLLFCLCSLLLGKVTADYLEQ
jgi:hypothetical protein